MKKWVTGPHSVVIRKTTIEITAIYYLDFIHRPYVMQPQRFKGWFLTCHQVKPNLLGPVDRASLYRWT
jgi:hypothetical protein